MELRMVPSLFTIKGEKVQVTSRRKNMEKIRLLIYCLVAILLTSETLFNSADRVWGQEVKYPTRSIEIVCPWGAGGTSDLLTRAVARGFEKNLNVQVVTVDKPGAAEIVGTSYLTNAKPDGYTLGVLTDAGIFLGILSGTATYSKEDLRVVGQLTISNFVMAVRADSPWKTIQEFIDYARKNPGVLYGDTGPGSNGALRMLYFNKIAGTKMRAVSYKSDMEALTAVLGNNVAVANVGYATAGPQEEAGKVRILFAFTPPGKGPLPDAPNIVTVFGKGVSDFEPHGHHLVAPGKTPEYIIKILDQALEKITKDPEFIAAVKTFGLTVYYTNSTTAPKEIERRISQVKPVLEEQGLIKK